MPWSKLVLDHFAARAIDPEVAAELGVRENGHGLEFPYPNGVAEQFARTRGLNGAGPKVRQPAGTRLCPWQPVPSDETREVLVCEGESDLLAAVSALRRSPLEELRDLPVIPSRVPAFRQGASRATCTAGTATGCGSRWTPTTPGESTRRS